MAGSVLAEFAFGPGKDLANMTEADSEKLVKDTFGPEGGGKVLDAFRKSYPNTDPAFAADMDDMFLTATVDYVKKKAKESSAPVYNYMFAKVFDYDGGKAAWHCSDIPYFFHNAEMIPVCLLTLARLPMMRTRMAMPGYFSPVQLEFVLTKPHPQPWRNR